MLNRTFTYLIFNSFIYSCTLSLSCLSVHSLTCLFSISYSLINSYFLFLHSFDHPFIFSLIDSLVHSFTLSFIYLFIHSFDSFIHSHSHTARRWITDAECVARLHLRGKNVKLTMNDLPSASAALLVSLLYLSVRLSIYLVVCLCLFALFALSLSLSLSLTHRGYKVHMANRPS